MQQKQQIIDADKRLSQSLIWHIQRRYFLQTGLRAWQEDVVPHTISCNPFMARAYSQLVLGYLRDCQTAVSTNTLSHNPNQPIYIIELGAGSGRLLHNFIHQFYPLWQQSPCAHWPIKFVLTDFVPSLLTFWQQHPKLQPWVDAGLLDFALFDATNRETPPILHHSQQPLTPATVQNPLILLANYFFDSIPQDSFVLADGQLCHNLLTLLSSQPEPNLDDPTLWDRLSLAYEPIPLFDPPYNEPIYNEILDAYEAYLPDTTFSFPNVGLDCLRYWQRLANGRLLLLSSDRGHTQPETLLDQSDPLPNLHGSFSLMVNYHAITQYVTRSGGRTLTTPHYQDNLQTVAYLLGDIPAGGQATAHAFQHTITQGGPDDFFALKTALEPRYSQLTLPQLLSWLRFSGWDADIFHDCYPTLLTHLTHCDPAWHPDITQAINTIWQQYLPLHPHDPLPDQLRHLLHQIDPHANLPKSDTIILKQHQHGEENTHAATS